jgi:hypothetical protein
MGTSESLRALRRANPRTRAGFAESVEAAGAAVAARLDAAGAGVATHLPLEAARRRGGLTAPRRRLVGLSAAGFSLAAAAAVALALTVGSPGGGPGVNSAAAAVKQAATVTAAAAEHSGTAVVRITHGGELWAGVTIAWNGENLALSRGHPSRSPRVGDEFRLVDGMMYGLDDHGGWVELGPPSSIDPDSGTTPDEVLAAVQEDVGGATLRRITDGMTGLTTQQLDDGSSVYSGTVAAGLVARESGFKEGQHIRVFPFGYVAHDEAADPASPLDVAVTVGADGVVREIAVTWGESPSAWSYTVTYSQLGATPGPAAPENVHPLLKDRIPPPPAEPANND